MLSSPNSRLNWVFRLLEECVLKVCGGLSKRIHEEQEEESNKQGKDSWTMAEGKRLAPSASVAAAQLLCAI